MKLEHVALLVKDPVAVADWYVEHLGRRIVRQGEAPTHARFVADAQGASLLELYAGSLPLPDYRSMDPLLLHVAFSSADVAADRARLIAAGAAPVSEVVCTDAGDTFAMLRDPWGLALQLVRRAMPLV